MDAKAFEASDLLIIQKGPVALKPQFELTERFNDNITYRDDENKESDFLTVISPGLTIQAGDRTFNYIDLTYFYDRLEYLDHSELSANQHRVSLTSHLAKRRFLLEGRDEFQRLATPLGGGISIGGSQIERTLWNDQYRLTYEVSNRTGVYLEAFHSTTDFESGVRLYDSFTLMGTLGFEYKAFSRTSFFGEVYYGMTESTRNAETMPEYPTANFVGGFVGARGNFTEKLTGTVKAGYESRWYENVSGTLSAPVVETSLMARFTDRTILTLTYSRRQRESVQFVRSSYTSDSVIVNLLQHIGNDGRFRANINGSYNRYAYDENPQFRTGERTDELITAGLTISYDIKLWLRAFGSYDFEYLNSNEPAVIDYTVNRVAVGLELGY
jgi:hypothetical protein